MASYTCIDGRYSLESVSCRATVGDVQPQNIVREKALLHEELKRTNLEKAGIDEQFGSFFLYVILPFALLFTFFSLVRNRS